MTLYTVGYGQWETKERVACLLQALKAAEVTMLVDIRHSPCASNLEPRSNYGPKAWNLQVADGGIVPYLEREGIAYRWLSELGNPQKNDPAMAILRAHIASGDDQWPVNRGLTLLRPLVLDDGIRCCLLCECPRYDRCHRKLIAETVRVRFFVDRLELRDLSRP